MAFFDVKTRESKQIVAGAQIRTFWGEQTLLSLVDIEPGVEVPLHTHPNEQSGIILNGELEMGIEKEVKILSEGDIYIIPAGVEHYAKSYSGKAQVLDIFTPVREDYKY